MADTEEPSLTVRTVRAIKAEALTDAAEKLNHPDTTFPDVDLHSQVAIIRWLFEAADAVRDGRPL